jgi:hypothetical protein
MSTKLLGPNFFCACQLHCKSTRLVQIYNHEMDLQCTQHKVYERIYFIYLHTDYLSDDDFSYMINKWDTELIQYKLHSEKRIAPSTRIATLSGALRLAFGCPAGGCWHTSGSLS